MFCVQVLRQDQIWTRKSKMLDINFSQQNRAVQQMHFEIKNCWVGKSSEKWDWFLFILYNLLIILYIFFYSSIYNDVVLNYLAVLFIFLYMGKVKGFKMVGCFFPSSKSPRIPLSLIFYLLLSKTWERLQCIERLLWNLVRKRAIQEDWENHLEWNRDQI